MNGLPDWFGADPDAIVSLCAHIGREWSYGVRVYQVSGLPDGGAIASCGHSDGSRWFVATDRYACDVVNADTVEATLDMLRAATDARELARVRAIVADDDVSIDWVN